MAMNMAAQDKFRGELIENLLTCLEEADSLPHTILVGREQAVDLLAPFAKKLRAKLELTDKMPATLMAIENMSDSLMPPEE